jgi:uncharacterized membrane protein
MDTPKLILKILLAAIMVFAGVMHFLKPGPFVRIVPHYLPYALALVYISGFFEIAGGVGLLVPATSRIAAWGLVALYVAVFPANVNMAINNIPFGEGPTPAYVLWLRLPLQAVLIAWAAWFALE